MSLRSKIALVLFVAASLVCGVDLFLRHKTFERRVRHLDRDRVLEHVGRVEAGIAEKARQLESAGRDLEDRLATQYEEPPGFMPLRGTAAGGSLDVAMIYDADGWVSSHWLLDPLNGEPARVRQLPNEKLASDHPLVTRDGAFSGLLPTELGAVLISVRPLPSRPGKPARRLAVGHFLAEATLADLRALSGVALDIVLVQGRTLGPEEEQTLARIGLSEQPWIESAGGSLHAWSVVRDLRGNPLVLYSFEVPSELAEFWEAATRYALTSTLIVIVLFPFVVLLLLQWIVTGPLSALTEHVVRIGHSNDTDARLALNRGDEIGQLADEFDFMLEKLESSRAEVIDSARMAGMAEVATGVIHNVGNVLNSVNVSASRTKEKLEGLRVQEMQAVARLMVEHADDLEGFMATDKRAQALPRFMRGMSEHMGEVRGLALREIVSLEKNIAHIREIVTSQQEHAKVAGTMERLCLRDLVEDALDVCAFALEDGRVRVVRNYEDELFVRTDRHRVVHLLVNLIKNARESMVERGGAIPTLTIRTEASESEARIHVIDSGVGIAPDDLSRIFQHGFTTKKSGHGFGLHSAALTATELSGSLAASSDGLGKGATFSVTLPLSRGADEDGGRDAA